MYMYATYILKTHSILGLLESSPVRAKAVFGRRKSNIDG